MQSRGREVNTRRFAAPGQGKNQMRYVNAARATVFSLLSLLVLLAPTLVGASPAEAQTGTIRGQVTDAFTGEVIPIARISVEGTRLRARADEDGRFTLTGVPVGSVVVVAEFLGYEPERREVRVGRGRATTVDFALEGK